MTQAEPLSFEEYRARYIDARPNRRFRTIRLVEVRRAEGGWSQELLDHIAAGNTVVWS